MGKQDRQCTYNVTVRRVRVTIVAVEKSVSVTYSERVFVALGIQYANAHALYYIVNCGLSGSKIFSHIIS